MATASAEKRHVLILAASQALLLTAAVLGMTLGAIVGHGLADDKSLATLPVAAAVVGTLCASVPASYVLKLLGWRGGFLLGAAIGATGGLVGAFAIYTHQFALFVVGYFLFGIYQGFGNYYRFAAAEAASPAYKSRAISLVLAGGVVAAIAGPALATWARDLVAAAAFTGAYLAQAVLGFIAIGILSLLDLRHGAEGQHQGKGRPLGVILRQPVFVTASIGAAIGYAVMILAMTAAPLAMLHHHHTVNDAAFAIQAHVLGMFLPSFFTGALIARYGVLRIMTAGALLLGGHVVIALTGIDRLHFVSALILLGVGWNFLYIGGTTLLTEAHTPEERARTQAANELIVFGTVAVASLSSGWLLHHIGWQAVNLSAVPFLTLTIGLIAWLAWRQRDAVVPPRAGVDRPLTEEA